MQLQSQDIIFASHPTGAASLYTLPVRMGQPKTSAALLGPAALDETKL